jgi:catechol 2,3-dioxygenase-like lactoylglutathione lyase family enzyme
MDILEISLLSGNLETTAAFYRDVLGLSLISRTPANISFRAGQSKLIFSYVEDRKPVFHFAFNIPCNRLNSVVRHLQYRTEILPASPGGELVADFKSWNAKSVYFNDNNGNILECIARMDLHNESTRTDAAASLLNISEIAFVVEDVPEAQVILQQSGIPLYSKGPQLKDFSVLGDDNGLVILKDTKDGWMPNNAAPHAFESEAVVRQADQIFRIELKDKLSISKLEGLPTA